MPDQLYLRTLGVDDLSNMSLDQLAGLQLGHRSPGDRVVNAFKQLGKFIFADRWAREQTTALQKIVVGSMNQTQAANADFYDDMTEAIMPFRLGMSSTIKALEDARTYAATACRNLLTKAIAVDFGLPAGTELAHVGDELIYAMRQNNLSVAGRGDSPNGFAMFFFDVLDILLPASDSPNILDSWVADDLV